jgi:hypothetical protein
MNESRNTHKKIKGRNVHLIRIFTSFAILAYYNNVSLDLVARSICTNDDDVGLMNAMRFFALVALCFSFQLTCRRIKGANINMHRLAII